MEKSDEPKGDFKQILKKHKVEFIILAIILLIILLFIILGLLPGVKDLNYIPV